MTLGIARPAAVAASAGRTAIIIVIFITTARSSAFAHEAAIFVALAAAVPTAPILVSIS
jgi:hypothetical protein